MKRIPLATAALALALAAPAAAQTVPPIQYDTFTLANGLKFIVHEDRSTPVVAVNVYYDVGSAHEPPGRSGFAHLFEHMLFQETENLEKGAFMRMIPAAGGEFNGTTNEDRTMYYEVLPSNRLNLALWMEAERMARLQVTEENFQREREVVKEERRLRIENAPYGESFLAIDTLAADYEPYDHSVIGSMEDLDAATVEDVRAFYDRFYNPNNAAVVVAGDVTVEEVRRLAEEYFGDIARGPELEPLPTPTPTPRLDGERRLVLEDDLANLPLLYTAYNIPPHRDDDTYALSLLARILGTGESSRLYQRIVQQEGAALQVFAGLNSRYGPGTFLIGGLPNQGVSVERLESLILEEVQRLIDEGVTERELQKAKNQVRADGVRSRLTVMSKSEQLQHARFQHGDIGAVNQDLDRYMEVTVREIIDAARTYLTAANRTVVVTVPQRTTT